METKSSSFKQVLKLSVVALFLSGSNAQQIPGIELQSDGIILDNLNKAVKPIKDALEPWKTHEGDFERGVPKTHDKYGKLLLIPILFFYYK